MKCLNNSCKRLAVSKGYCDKHYRRLLKHGDANSCSRVVSEGTAAERFHQKYKIDEVTGCWIWIAGTRPNGKGVLYGRHWSDSGVSIGAHRFSYQLFNGDIPDGLYVCHHCDTPLCVNPLHLFLSDHKGNMKDMVDKGRSSKASGEDKWGLAKLTNDEARKIRNIDLAQSKIAEMFGVSQTTISRIKRGVSYS